jgi:site-specific recombinase XerC
MSRVRDDDVQLVEQWAASLAEAGMAPSAVVKAGKRVRAFAQVTHNGLLYATRDDVAAFAAARAARLHGGHADPLRATLRGRSLRQTVAALRQFYDWAAVRGLVDLRRAPTAGLRLPPPPRRLPLGMVAARPYDHVLHAPGPPRDVALVWLLAFGLTPQEITTLRPADVDLEGREVRLPHRTMPLSPRAVGALRPWVQLRQHLPAGEWLFCGKHGRRASRSAPSNALRRLARQCDSRAGEASLRRAVTAAGLRQLLIVRAFRRGIAVDCLPELLGIPLPRKLGRYVGPITRERLHRELHKISRRWRRWIW